MTLSLYPELALPHLDLPDTDSGLHAHCGPNKLTKRGNYLHNETKITYLRYAMFIPYADTQVKCHR